MPISEYPFSRQGPVGPFRPLLPIEIINPATNLNLNAWGLIDTGADDCALPASYAQILGHNLQAGTLKQIVTGNGVTNAYAHTTRVNIFHYDKVNNLFDQTKIVHTIQDTPVDFMPNLQCILLGVNNFLSGFILTIDYQKQVFSIKYPTN